MERAERAETTETAGTTGAPPGYSLRIAAASEAAAPDFSAEWAQIRRDLEGEAEGALRIGRNLIKIRDALKPLHLWLAALREHGMSQPQASRYIRFAGLPERDREIYQRDTGFSLSRAIGERRGKRGAGGEAGAAPEGEAEIPEGERAERLAEIDRQLKLGIRMVQAGEAALGAEPPRSARGRGGGLTAMGGRGFHRAGNRIYDVECRSPERAPVAWPAGRLPGSPFRRLNYSQERERVQ